MVTAKEILKLAKAEIGVKESPSGSNKVKYNDEYGKGNIAWCCVFLWWLFKQANASKLFFNGTKTAWCPSLLIYHTKVGQLVTDGKYRPGDIGFFNFSGGNSAEHVGLIEKFDGEFVTSIDGNSGNNGTVMRRRREVKYLIAAIRPAYTLETPKLTMNDVSLPVLTKGIDAPTYVTTLQILLAFKGYYTDKIDGSFGPNTDKAFKAWQEDSGLDTDGSCGPNSWTVLLGGDKT